MAEFDRGLDDNFVDLLNQAYAKPNSWWRKLVEDPDLFVGIRGNYLNVYYNGASLLRLEGRHGHLVGKTHFKFLIGEKPKGPYVSFQDGQFKEADLSAIEYSRHVFHDIKAIKAASMPYQGIEAKGVHQIIRSNYNVIDIEAVFGAEASRIDIVAIRPAEQRPEIVFYEAKHFSNPEIAGKEPKVFEQIEKYGELLSNPQRIREIENSYGRVVANYAALKGFDPRFQALSQRIESDGLGVSSDVRLVIYGFDRAQQRDSKILFDRLREKTGSGYLLLRGNPKGLVRGVSQ